MSPRVPALLWNIAEEIRVCVCNALADDGSCQCPCRTCTVWGQPVFDNCCDGQLTVDFIRLYVHDNFPQAASGPVFCATPLAAEFRITYVRCAPVVKDDGSPPTCDELSTEALGMMTDVYVVYRALICCLQAQKRNRKFVMSDATPISPEGGCQGFEIRLTIEVEDTLSD